MEVSMRNCALALYCTVLGCSFDTRALPANANKDGSVSDHFSPSDILFGQESSPQDVAPQDVSVPQDTAIQQDVLTQTDAPPFAQCTGITAHFSPQKIAQIQECNGYKVDSNQTLLTPEEVVNPPNGVCALICTDKAGGGKTVLPDQCCGLWKLDPDSGQYVYDPWCQTGCRQMPGHEGQSPDQSGCVWNPTCTTF